MFNQYPYINENDLNLDFILKSIKKLKEIMDNFITLNSITFADPIIWNISTQYARNTIVVDPSGNAYLSKEVVPAGVQLNNSEYWLEIFNFTDYTRTANQNLTVNVETNTTRATAAYAVDDWLIWNDVLYKVTANIAIDDALVIGTNLVHFTVEDFLKAFITYATGLINQYKNDIDASELAFTTNLQQQFNLVISGATVDSEVILARVGANGITYSTLGDAIRTQFEELYYSYDNYFSGNFTASNGNPASGTAFIISRDYIDINDLIYLEVLNPFRFQIYCYDSNYVGIGYYSTSNVRTITRSEILAIIPTTKYIRFKISRSDGVDATYSDMVNNGYTSYFRSKYPTDNYLLDFENGNIQTPVGNVVYSANSLVSDILPVESFVIASTGLTMQVYCYDENYIGLGYYDGSTHKVITPNDILTGQPTTKYIRIKVRGTNITLSDFETNCTCIVLNIPDSVLKLGEQNVSLLNKLLLNSNNGVFDSNFTMNNLFYADTKACVLKIRSKYTGTRPLFNYELRNASGTSLFSSTLFKIGGLNEYLTQYIRIVPKMYEYQNVRFEFSISSGSTLEIEEAEIISDFYNNSNIEWVSHLGYAKMCPQNTMIAFDVANAMNYKTMVTTPKFTSDGVAVCFHDDDSIRTHLRYKDGSAITAGSADDHPIEFFTYQYILDHFSAGYYNNSIYAGCVVPTVDDYLRFCSLNGIKPMFSIHPTSMYSGATGDTNFTALKALCEKWNVLDKTRIKTGAGQVMQCIANNFDGPEIGGVILIRALGQFWDPLAVAKQWGLAPATATSAKESPFILQFEMFNTEATTADIQLGLNEGFNKVSLALNQKVHSDAFDSYIAAGATEFCVDYIAQNGLFY